VSSTEASAKTEEASPIATRAKRTNRMFDGRVCEMSARDEGK